MDNLPLKILIVEDNISFALELEMILDEMGYQIIASVDNSGAALDIIFSQEPDLILMDIDIKGALSGTEIGQKIQHLNIPIIFITSFDDKEKYAEASQSNMAAYLIKPISKFTLESTIDLIVKKTMENNRPIIQQKETIFETFILIKKNKTYYNIALENIQYVEAARNYSILYVGKDKFISNLNFTDIEGILPPHSFLKIHRSYSININYLYTINIEENTVQMDNNNVIPISRNNKQILLDRMNIG